MFTNSNKQSAITRALLIVLTPFILFSCGDDGEDNPLGLPLKDEGFFIVNEGGFGNSNTSLSFFSLETGAVTNNIFQMVNGRPLGDQSQSMTIHRDEGFIVVQNSAKIEVIDIDNFESVATISEGITSPRYFIGLDNDKGYVSDWGVGGLEGVVHVIDLENYSVTQTISTGVGSNEMIIRGDQLYVANAGGIGLDNTITVINTNTDEIVQTIKVGDNPSNFELDKDGNIWVLGKGNVVFDFTDFSIIEEQSTLGYLSRLNSSNVLDTTYDLTEITFSTADDLVINEEGNRLYFTFNGKVWEFDTSSSSLPSTPFISQSLYGLGLDPTTGNLIGTEAPDFSAGGNMIFYDGSGAIVSTITVGIGPNSAIYKN